MSQMLKSSGAMAGATLTSRVLGLARETVYAAFMGDTWQASSFFLAFQVPNLFRRLLGEGALTAAFIPIFKRTEVAHGQAEMWRIANAVISGLLVAAGVVTLVVMAGLSVVLRVHSFDYETALMLNLLRMMFPYMLLVCLAAVLIGMANARGHFFVPALGSVALNLVLIASVLWLAPRLGNTLELQIRGLAIGVVAAGMVQAAFQLPGLNREGFRYHWVSPWNEPAVREVVRKMVPGSIGVAAFQINVLVIFFFSYFYEKSIIAAFNYAVRLMELPQGMFGISLATYLLPTLSGLASQKNYGEFRRTLGQGLGHLALANLLATAIAVSLAQPIVRLLFERGKFDAYTTYRVAHALQCLAPGLLMFSMNNILARAFYALHDIATPMKISILCLGLNLGFSLWLIHPWAEMGLGVANTLSATFNLMLLMYALRRKLARLGLTELTRTLQVLVPAAIAAGLAAVALSAWWGKHLGHATLTLKVGQVFAPAAAAGLVYGSLALAFKVPAAREMCDLLLNRFRR